MPKDEWRSVSKKELQDFADSHLGMRLKEDANHDITIYGNAWTVVVDIYKWVKSKF
jgi:hypothetical protein